MSETVTLGGREFKLQALPWGRLKKLTAGINRVGRALAVGLVDEATFDAMAQVLAVGLDIPLEELEQLPTDWHEASNAFRALMRVSGMEREMEHTLGEMKRLGLKPEMVQALMSSTPGIGSMPASSQQPAGDGKTATA